MNRDELLNQLRARAKGLRTLGGFAEARLSAEAAEAIEHLQFQIAGLKAVDEVTQRYWKQDYDELQRARADVKRLDWLADRDNPVGNVQLPTECVNANLADMRAAIDAAMLL